MAPLAATRTARGTRPAREGTITRRILGPVQVLVSQLPLSLVLRGLRGLGDCLGLHRRLPSADYRIARSISHDSKRLSSPLGFLGNRPICWAARHWLWRRRADHVGLRSTPRAGARLHRKIASEANIGPPVHQSIERQPKRFSQARGADRARLRLHEHDDQIADERHGLRLRRPALVEHVAVEVEDLLALANVGTARSRQYGLAAEGAHRVVGHARSVRVLTPARLLDLGPIPDVDPARMLVLGRRSLLCAGNPA